MSVANITPYVTSRLWHSTYLIHVFVLWGIFEECNHHVNWDLYACIDTCQWLLSCQREEHAETSRNELQQWLYVPVCCKLPLPPADLQVKLRLFDFGYGQSHNLEVLKKWTRMYCHNGWQRAEDIWKIPDIHLHRWYNWNDQWHFSKKYFQKYKFLYKTLVKYNTEVWICGNLCKRKTKVAEMRTLRP
jgi:hypothetical protein